MAAINGLIMWFETLNFDAKTILVVLAIAGILTKASKK